jgi:filamentous hemagglutinin family protein
MSGLARSWGGAIAIGLIGGMPAGAQVIPDGTLPTGATVTPLDPLTWLIEGGTQSGGNRFQSFDQFDLPTGVTARFGFGAGLGAGLVPDRLLVRVRGAASMIDGTLAVDGPSDLFLFNARGIVFGPNAQLNLTGSFLASTASSVRFADGRSFDTVVGQPSDLLSITAPIGLQFSAGSSAGSSTGFSTATIDVQGNGSQLELNPDYSLFRDNRSPGLTVADNQTLSLVAGNLTLSGGNLTGGRVLLTAIGAGDATLSVEAGTPWQIQSPAPTGRLLLDQAASVDVSSAVGLGAGLGAIAINAGGLDMADGSVLLATTLGPGGVAGGGGTIAIEATDVTVRGVAANLPLFSYISTDTYGDGLGGQIVINSDRLTVRDGAQIAAGSLGSGASGSVTIGAKQVTLIGGSEFGPSGLFSPTAGSGAGGDIKLRADRVTVLDGAEINAATFGAGNGGRLNLNIGDLVLDNGDSGFFSSLNASAISGSTGQGGSIELGVDRLQAIGGTIVAAAQGEGAGGSIQIHGNTGPATVTLSKAATIATNTQGPGVGGNLSIVAESLTVSEGSQIFSSTNRDGAAGDLSIEAQHLVVDGRSDRVNSSIQASVGLRASGQGGRLNLIAGDITLSNGGSIGVSTVGSGDGGSLSVQAQRIDLSGRSALGRSGIFGNAIAGTGNGGNLTIAADQLSLTDGARISVSNFQSQNRLPPGQGAPGSINLIVQSLTLQDSSIDANSANPNQPGGAIGIQADRIDLSRSEISASGGSGNLGLNTNLLSLRASRLRTDAKGPAIGGNIDLNANLLFAIDNSDITANAEQNLGGQIRIQTQGLFGATSRTQLTPQSDIVASSDLGTQFSGRITVSPPNANLTPALAQLPSKLAPAAPIRQACRAGDIENLIISGRSQVQSPFSAIGSDAVWLGQTRDTGPSGRSASLSEAQGWRTQNGRIELVDPRVWANGAIDCRG